MKPILILTALLLASCSKPEGDLKSHYEKMEAIMADGKEDPEKGMEKFIKYFEDNAAEMSWMGSVDGVSPEWR